MKKLVTATVVAILLAACATDEGTQTEPTEEPSPAAAAVDSIAVELGEWSVLPDYEVVEAAEITFAVTNGGQEAHEFVVAEGTDLPTAEDGSVDEDAAEILGEVEELEPGEDGELALDLGPGTYRLFCNIVEEEDGEVEAHYKLGMRTDLQVT